MSAPPLSEAPPSYEEAQATSTGPGYPPYPAPHGYQEYKPDGFQGGITAHRHPFSVQSGPGQYPPQPFPLQPYPAQPYPGQPYPTQPGMPYIGYNYQSGMQSPLPNPNQLQSVLDARNAVMQRRKKILVMVSVIIVVIIIIYLAVRFSF